MLRGRVTALNENNNNNNNKEMPIRMLLKSYE